MGEPKCHHRGNWRHPDLRVASNKAVCARWALRQQWRNVPAAVVVRAGEERRPVRATSSSIPLNFEKPTVRSKSRKIRMTRTAGLSRLPRVTWKRLCRPLEANQQKPGKGTHRHCGEGEPEEPRGAIRSTAVVPHSRVPYPRDPFAPARHARTQRP